MERVWIHFAPAGNLGVDRVICRDEETVGLTEGFPLGLASHLHSAIESKTKIVSRITRTISRILTIGWGWESASCHALFKPVTEDVLLPEGPKTRRNRHPQTHRLGVLEEQLGCSAYFCVETA